MARGAHRNLSLLTALIGVLLLGTDRAHAACNTIGERPVLYQSTLGSIDRPFIRFGCLDPACNRDTVSVQFASWDARERVAAATGTDLDPAQIKISFFFHPTDETPTDQPITPIVIVGGDDCSGTGTPQCWLERLLCHEGPECVTGSTFGLSTFGSTAAGRVTFRPPDALAAGPLTIAVTLGQNAPLPHLQTTSCAALLSKYTDSTLLACIDTIAQPASALAAVGARESGPSAPTAAPIFTQLVALPPTNNFGRVCNPKQGSPCQGSDELVNFTVDADGNLLLSMYWGGVIAPAPNPPAPPPRRTVTGSSPVAPFTSDVPGPILIPNAAYLESVAADGTTFNPPPDFRPESDPTRPNELTLTGTADKDTSVLRILRRRPWNYACVNPPAPTAACEPASASADCGRGTCAPLETPRYFACSTGPRAGLPCTSMAQCGGGACLLGTDCISKSTGKATGTCKVDSDCPTGSECGRGLFDFRKRVQQGIGKLRRTGGNELRVCDGGTTNGKLCTASLSCWDGLTPHFCVGFRATAGALSTSPP